jgi:hypothetical protein
MVRTQWSSLQGTARDATTGLDRRRISATVLLAENTKKKDFTQKDIRKLVFERLNTGGQTLNTQELRNCLYAGCFNDQLTKLASNRLFTEIWEIPSYADNVDAHGFAAPVLREDPLYKRMLDCQIVLRFFALRETSKIKGSVRLMLDDCMERNQGMSQEEADAAGSTYLEVLRVAHSIFGKRVFRYKNTKGKWTLSLPLYDGIMIAISRVLSEKDRMVADKTAIIRRVEKLLEDPKSYEVIVGRPNTAQAIRDRLRILTEAVEGRK